MDRYFEIDKHILRDRKEARVAFDRALNYMIFEVGNTSILGDNIIIMWSNDYNEMRNKAEKYSLLINGEYGKK